MDYFSEREYGERPRQLDAISETAWRGIRALVESLVDDGSFGVSYKEVCPDGSATVGTNAMTFRDAMRSQVPDLPESPWGGGNAAWGDVSESAKTAAILDMIQFCWKKVGKPISRNYHNFFSHHHLQFDIAEGRREFQEEIELIFQRNGIAFTLTERGRIERLIPSVLHEPLVDTEFATGDFELDRLLNTAVRKFVDSDTGTRSEALEALWDAWERLKTLDGSGNKAKSAQAMLDAVAGGASPKFRAALEREANELTEIGNSLRIRHSETDQEQIASGEHEDYLFYRLFVLIRLVLRTM